MAGCPYALGEGQNYGAAYVFQRSGKHWHSGKQTAKLTAATAEVVDGTPAVGCSVAIDGDQIAVGAIARLRQTGRGMAASFLSTKDQAPMRSTSRYNAVEYDPNAASALQLGVSRESPALRL